MTIEPGTTMRKENVVAENYSYSEQAEATSLTPPKQGEIHQALNGLLQRIKKARAQLDQLGTRLAPVLRETKDELGEPAVEEVFGSELACQIRDAGDDVVAMDRRISALLERLQI